MPEPAELIAQHLAKGLVHPGDGKPFALPLPMFQTTALPPEMAEEFADQAGLPTANIPQLTAEAIVHLLEQNGYTILDSTEFEQLVLDATEITGRHRQPRITCTCGQFLFSLNIDTEKPTVNGPKLITALGSLKPECPHQ